MCSSDLVSASVVRTASMHGPARLPASTHGGSDMRRINQRRARGQGMTEYIIIVALIAVAAIGDIVRGQTSLTVAVAAAFPLPPTS